MKTMKFLLPLALALGLASFTGCSSRPKSPAQIAHNATATVITTGDAAIEAWGDYVYFEQIRIDGMRQAADALPPGPDKDNAIGKVMGAKSKLLIKEGRVSAAYEKYQTAAIAAVKAGAASADLSGNITQDIAAAAAPLLALVPQLMASD